ncbi:protein PIF-like [Mytilus edulis]|uniref:protein PIF-like n=1 Tax=Mytilus edulis TaxID=6550 RepID=UPI0039EFDE1B
MLITISTILFMFQVDVRIAQTVVPPTNCKNELDLVFLLDGSQSVTKPNFDLVKNYTVNLISRFEIHPTHTRVGIVEFGTFIGTKIELGQYDTLDALSVAILSMQMSNYGTSTHKAIKLMRGMFSRSPRPGSTKVAVCITDGLSVSPNYTKIESMAAHEEGIHMFALGIGQHVFKTELVFIASQMDYVKEVPDYSALPTNLAAEICNLNFETTTATYKSTTPEDLAIDRIDGTPITGAVNISTTTATSTTNSVINGGTVSTSTTSNNIINDGSVDVNRQFLPHPTDCDKYIETEDAAGILVFHERYCPFGQFYNENALTCVQPKHSTCKLDLCRDKLTAPMKNNCRGYWVCLNGDITGVCCPLGTGYSDGSGCKLGACNSECPPTVNNNSTLQVCSLKPVANDPTLYLEHVTGHGTITRQCAPGTAFEQSSCSCSALVQIDNSNNNKNQTIDATTTPKTLSCTTNLYLTFDKSTDDPSGMKDRSGMSTPLSCHNINITDTPDGKALFGYQDCFIYLWRFASIDFRNLVIEFQFAPLIINSDTNFQSVLTNCYPSPTCDPSFALLIDRSKSLIGIRLLVNSVNDIEMTVSEWISYKVEQTNAVQVHVNLHDVVFEVNKISKIIHLDGSIFKRQSGFAFGLGGPYDSFEGYLDEIKISSC